MTTVVLLHQGESQITERAVSKAYSQHGRALSGILMKYIDHVIAFVLSHMLFIFTRSTTPGFYSLEVILSLMDLLNMYPEVSGSKLYTPCADY